MSAFSRAVSGFRPLALTSCMMQHGVNGMLGAHMPDTAAEAMLGTGVRTGRVRPHEQVNGLHQGDTCSGQGRHLMHSERSRGVAGLGAEAEERGVRPRVRAYALARHAAQELEGGAQQPGRQLAGGGRLAGLQRQIEGHGVGLHTCMARMQLASLPSTAVLMPQPDMHSAEL